MYFEYGEKELIYLKQKDKRLAEVINQVGMIERTVDDDLFSSVVHHIVVSRSRPKHRLRSGRE